MNRTSLTLVIPLILLAIVVTTPITIIEDAFSRYQRHTGSDVSQAASITNSCLNPVSNSNTNDNMISNGNCGGTISQQGKSGQASNLTTVQNANPNIEVQRSTTGATDATPTTGSLTIMVVCPSCGGGTNLIFTVLVTDSTNKQYFVPFDGSGNQAININPGAFGLALIPAPTNAVFSGGCTGTGTGTGTINAGQSVTCTITIS